MEKLGTDMVIDVIGFSTNQKSEKFCVFFWRFIGNGKDCLDEIFYIVF